MNEEQAATISHMRLVQIEIDAAMNDGDYHAVGDHASFLGQLACRALQHERANRELSE